MSDGAATDAAREAEASLPPVKLDWGSRRFTHCQATEDDCTYERCPRWRDGKLISQDHCALDLIGADEESY